MRLSKFGEKFSRRTGIMELMEDLDAALGGGDVSPGSGKERPLMLGGGNPGRLPEVEAVLRARLRAVVDDPELTARVLGVYDNPVGDREFIRALAELLSREYGKPVRPENIALTNGSQNSFFFLFNMFAGECSDGVSRRVLLPVIPEYIGYTDAGLTEDFFTAQMPRIVETGPHSFKYGVDFEGLEKNFGPDGPLRDQVGALCVSRPTNPTGNVLTDAEMERLLRLARELDVPLIVDCAYGSPFPGLVYREAGDFYDPHVIQTLSLSKFGLPGARTGIVVAREDVIQALGAMNAVVNLSTGSIGPALALDLARSGEILRISREIIRPHYESRARAAREHFMRVMDPGLDYAVHETEGAFFLWIAFRGLPITTRELYERLKARGVLVVPGRYYFPGLREPWRHTEECIRVSYAQDEETVRAGLDIIAREATAAYG